MRLVAVTALLFACNSTEPGLQGKVVDNWGNPIEGATVMMVGLSDRPRTDGEGRYTVPKTPGKHEMKAGREGYVQAHTIFEVGEGTAEAPLFELFKKPDEGGFYAISTGRYDSLLPQKVEQVGNDLRQHRGLKEVGEIRAEGPGLKILFHTELSLDQIMRLGLDLHKLEFVKQAEVPGALAATKVKLNMYMAKEKIDIDLEPLHSRTDYLIKTKEPIEAGYYAFSTQNLLSADAEGFDALPEELRVAFPFEYR